MGIIKVLKRKDGATLVVGVALGIIVSTFVSSLTIQLADKISNAGNKGGMDQFSQDWRMTYLFPAVTFILSLAALELLVWIYVWIHGALNKK